MTLSVAGSAVSGPVARAAAGPAVVVQPSSAAAGTVVTVTGTGWDPASGDIDVYLAPGESFDDAAQVATAVADTAESTFSASFSVPADPVGGYTVTACQCGGGELTPTATTAFTILSARTAATLQAFPPSAAVGARVEASGAHWQPKLGAVTLYLRGSSAVTRDGRRRGQRDLCCEFRCAPTIRGQLSPHGLSTMRDPRVDQPDHLPAGARVRSAVDLDGHRHRHLDADVRAADHRDPSTRTTRGRRTGRGRGLGCGRWSGGAQLCGHRRRPGRGWYDAGHDQPGRQFRRPRARAESAGGCRPAGRVPGLRPDDTGPLGRRTVRDSLRYGPSSAADRRPRGLAGAIAGAGVWLRRRIGSRPSGRRPRPPRRQRRTWSRAPAARTICGCGWAPNPRPSACCSSRTSTKSSQEFLVEVRS